MPVDAAANVMAWGDAAVHWGFAVILFALAFAVFFGIIVAAIHREAKP